MGSKSEFDLKESKSGKFTILEAMNYARKYDFIANEYSNYFHHQLFDKSNKEILDITINDLVKIGLFKREDVIVKDIRSEKYANVIFDHYIYDNRKIVLNFLKDKQ